MPRVRKGAARAQSRKRTLREARGYHGVRSRHKYQAEINLMRAGRYRFRDRRRVKRDMRRLWVTRITAACKMRGTRYSVLINGLKMAGITLNRKMLSLVAIEDPKLFDTICEIGVKASRANGGGSEAKVHAGNAPAAARSIATFLKRPTASKPARAAVSASAPSGEGDIINIEGIGPVYRKKLKEGAKIVWIRELLEAGKSKDARATLAEKTGIKESLLLTWVNMADFFRLKGMTGDHAELLEKSGVDTVKELSKRIPANLHAKMLETNKETRVSKTMPSEQQVSDWVGQAKTLPGVVTH